jgi:hypothetical protein
MILNENYVEHLHGTVMMHLGSRNQALLPHTVTVRGALVSPDRELITIYVLESQTEQLLHNLNDNGRFSFVVANPVTLETYQFKGTFVSSRPSESKDEAVQTIYLNKINGLLGYMYPNQVERMNQMITKPMVCITLQVEDIFDQTPGPGTGNKIPQ